MRGVAFMFIYRELIKAFCLIEAVLGEDIKTFCSSNFSDLSNYHLGLGTWIRNNLLLSESDLYLFPLYLVPIIPEGLEVVSISGKKYRYEKEKADNDIRFGCVAYGIEIKESENK